MDIQDWYIAQIVAQGELDQLYTDAEAAEQNMAKEANLGQTSVAVAAGVAGALSSGGILTGLLVTSISPGNPNQTVVNVTAGVARDSDGERIVLAADATVALTNLGDTPQGDITNATGDGGLTASSITAGEAWAISPMKSYPLIALTVPSRRMAVSGPTRPKKSWQILSPLLTKMVW